jgi:hypothetical protein
MTTTRKVSDDDWANFCDTFSREHHGWLISVEVAGPEPDRSHEPATPKVLAQNLPLQEVREAQHNGDAEIMITVGEGADETSFLVEHVAAVFETSEAEKDTGMRIDSTNNTCTMLQFRVPATPQELDGISRSEL